MEAYGPLVDAEGMRGIGLCLLLKHDLARYDQAFVATPAHSQFEELEVVGKCADVDAFPEDEREQARRAVEPRRQAVGEPRMTDGLHDIEILETLCDRKTCGLVRLHAQRQ